MGDCVRVVRNAAGDDYELLRTGPNSTNWPKLVGAVVVLCDEGGRGGGAVQADVLRVL